MAGKGRNNGIKVDQNKRIKPPRKACHRHKIGEQYIKMSSVSGSTLGKYNNFKGAGSNLVARLFFEPAIMDVQSRILRCNSVSAGNNLDTLVLSKNEPNIL